MITMELKTLPTGGAASREQRCRGRKRFVSTFATSASSTTPARVRWLTAREASVALPLAASLFLCNANRVCLSVAVVYLQLPLQQAASVQSAFLYGYMVSQLPGGALADSIGGRTTLGVGIVVFALADACFPLAFPKSSTQPVIGLAIALRCLVGLGEGVAMPTVNSMLAHVDSTRKSTAVGCAFSGFHSGTIAGLLLSPLIIQSLSWRWVFYLFGGAGLPLLALWLSVVPESCSLCASPSASPSPLSKSPTPSPFASLRFLFRTSPAPYAVVLATVINHFGFFILLNWIPMYFSRLGLNLKSSALLSVIPWIAMAISSSASGMLADLCIRRGLLSRHQVRLLFQSIAFIVPAAMLFLISTTSSATLALLCFTAALTCKAFGQAGFVANQQEIAPFEAGKLAGISNTFGSLAGALGTRVAGTLLARTGTWESVFYLMASLYCVGNALWLMLCRVDPPEHPDN